MTHQAKGLAPTADPSAQRSGSDRRPIDPKFGVARAIERLTAGNPACPDCGAPSYAHKFVGSVEAYYGCSAPRCWSYFDADGAPVGLAALKASP